MTGVRAETCFADAGARTAGDGGGSSGGGGGAAGRASGRERQKGSGVRHFVNRARVVGAAATPDK